MSLCRASIIALALVAACTEDATEVGVDGGSTAGGSAGGDGAAGTTGAGGTSETGGTGVGGVSTGGTGTGGFNPGGGGVGGTSGMGAGGVGAAGGGGSTATGGGAGTGGSGGVGGSAGAGGGGGATPLLHPKADFPAPSNPNSLAIGDVNGDGKPDLVVGNQNPNQVQVYRNTTSGGVQTPTFGTMAEFVAGDYVRSVAVGDLNADGKADIAVANKSSSNVSVLLNTTSATAVPTFATHVDFVTGLDPTSVAIGDLNGDSKPDLAVANTLADTVSVLLNATTIATTPSFSAKVPFATGAEPAMVVLGDINADGKPDIVSPNQAQNSVSVLINVTAANAAMPAFSGKVDFPTASYPVFVATADLNADGKLDLAVANAKSNLVSVLFSTTEKGAAAPSFSSKVDFATGSYPSSVAIANLGGGLPDIAVANSSSDTVSVLLNTTAVGASKPTLAAKVDFATQETPVVVASADLNADGKADLAVANIQGFMLQGSISVLIAQ